MNCKNCTKEFTPLRKTGQFCSPKCRKDYWSKNAKEVSVQNDKVSVPDIPKISVTTTETTVNRWGENVKEMDAKTLYAFIRAYSSDTWKDSPDFKELQKRLKGKTLKQLQEEGYWIPSWKNPVRI